MIRPLLHSLLLLTSFVPTLVAAQATEAQPPSVTVGGIVRDATGGALPNTQVTLRGSGLPHVTRSDAEGRFEFPAVPVGRYELRAELGGFAPLVLAVEIGTGAAPLELQLATLTGAESVTVTGSAEDRVLDVPSTSGSRLGLTMRETPATIDVIPFDRVVERGLRTTNDVLVSAPAVLVSSMPSTPGTATIRGFSGGAISTLFDGTRITTSSMVTRNYDAWTFDRIEILKGPASVLYGEGAIAGAINFVPKRPDFGRRHGEALVSYGSFNAPRAAIGLTGPVGTRAAYRVDAAIGHADGHIDNGAFGTTAVNGALDVRASSRLTLSVAVDHFRDRYDTAYWGTLLVPAAAAQRPSSLVTDSRGFVLDRSLATTNLNVTDAVTRSHATWVRGRVDWQFSQSWRLVNDAYAYDSLRTWKNAEVYAYQVASGLASRSTVSITHDHQFFGNRLAVAADHAFGRQRNRFAVGFEVNRNDFFNPRRFGTTSDVDPFAPDRGVFPADRPENFPGAGNRVDFTTGLTLVSAFAENALTVAPRLTVIAGLRRDRLLVERQADDLNAGTSVAFDRTFSPTSWRTGIVVDARRETQIFAQYTSAVAPVATVLLMSQANAAFDLTTGSSAEAGVKSTLLDGRLEATASVFHIEQDNILTRDPDNFNVTIQGGSQASTGVEFTVTGTAWRRLRADVNAAIMDNRFVTLLEAGGADRSGNIPPNVPERTASFWLSYALPAHPITLAAGVRHQGAFFTNNANSTRVAGFALLDAQIAWRTRLGDVTLRGRNLANQLYAEWTGASASQIMVGPSRAVDLSYFVRF